jgi:hypothetical protein
MGNTGPYRPDLRWMDRQPIPGQDGVLRWRTPRFGDAIRPPGGRGAADTEGFLRAAVSRGASTHVRRVGGDDRGHQATPAAGVPYASPPDRAAPLPAGRHRDRRPTRARAGPDERVGGRLGLPAGAQSCRALVRSSSAAIRVAVSTPSTSCAGGFPAEGSSVSRPGPAGSGDRCGHRTVRRAATTSRSRRDQTGPLGGDGREGFRGTVPIRRRPNARDTGTPTLFPARPVASGAIPRAR